MILSLSVELLQEIGAKVRVVVESLPFIELMALAQLADLDDRKRLRGACRALSFAINPLFFSSVTLDIHNRRLDENLSFLEGLASGRTGWSRYARNLKIARLSPGGEFIKKEDFEQVRSAHVRMERFLRGALESLKNVRSVMCVAFPLGRP